jgi:hypothetical protein
LIDPANTKHRFGHGLRARGFLDSAHTEVFPCFNPPATG